MMPEVADGRDRSPQVTRREGIGEVMLGRRLLGHWPGLVIPATAQSAGLVQGHLVQAAIGPDC
jgi:hypothetical protein